MGKKLTSAQIANLYRRASAGNLKGALRVKSYSKEDLEAFKAQIESEPSQALTSYDTDGNPVGDKSEKAKGYRESILSYVQDLIDNYEAYISEKGADVYVGERGSVLFPAGTRPAEETYEAGHDEGVSMVEDQISSEDLLAVAEDAYRKGNQRRRAKYDGHKKANANDKKLEEVVARLRKVERELESQKDFLRKKLGREGTLELVSAVLSADNQSVDKLLKEKTISIGEGIEIASKQIKQMYGIVETGTYEEVDLSDFKEEVVKIVNEIKELVQRYNANSDVLGQPDMFNADPKEVQEAWISLQSGQISQEEFDDVAQRRFSLVMGEESSTPVSYSEVYGVLGRIQTLSAGLSERLFSELNNASAMAAVGNEKVQKRAQHLLSLEKQIRDTGATVSKEKFNAAYDEMILADTLRAYLSGEESVTDEAVEAMYESLRLEVEKVKGVEQDEREEAVKKAEDNLRQQAKEKGFSDEDIANLFTERAKGVSFGGYQNRRDQYINDGVGSIELAEYWVRTATYIASGKDENNYALGVAMRHHPYKTAALATVALGAGFIIGLSSGLAADKKDTNVYNTDAAYIYNMLDDGKIDENELVQSLAGKLGDLEGIASIVDRMFEIQNQLNSGANIDRNALETEFNTYLQILKNYRENADDLIKQYIDSTMSIVDGMTTLSSIKPITDLLADGELSAEDKIALNNFASTENTDGTQRNIANSILNALKAAESSDVATLRSEFSDLINTYINMLESANAGALTPEQEQSLSAFEGLLASLANGNAYLQGMLKGVQDANANAKYKAEIESIVGIVENGINDGNVGTLQDLAQNGTDVQKPLAQAVLDLYNTKNSAVNDKNAADALIEQMKTNIKSMLDSLVAAGNSVDGGGSIDAENLAQQLKGLVAGVLGNNDADSLVDEIVDDYVKYSNLSTEYKAIVDAVNGGMTEANVAKLHGLANNGTDNQKALAQTILDLYNAKEAAESGRTSLEAAVASMRQSVQSMLTALTGAGDAINGGTFDAESVKSTLKELVGSIFGDDRAAADALVDEVVNDYISFNEAKQKADDVYNLFNDLLQDGKIDSADMQKLQEIENAPQSHNDVLVSFAKALKTSLEENANAEKLQENVDALVDYLQKYTELQQQLLQSGNPDVQTQLDELEAVEQTLADVVDPEVLQRAKGCIELIQKLQKDLADLESDAEINAKLSEIVNDTAQSVIKSYLGKNGSNLKVKIDGVEYTEEQVKGDPILENAYYVGALRKALGLDRGTVPSVDVNYNVNQRG